MREQAGFTVIELVMVIVLMGVIVAVALPRLADSGLNERRLLDETTAALRSAQKTAIAAHRTVCASFSANSVSFRISSTYGAANCTTGSALNGPEGGVLAVTAQGSASFSSFPASLIFDAGGAVATTTIISVTGSGSVTVEAGTGYVH